MEEEELVLGDLVTIHQVDRARVSGRHMWGDAQQRIYVISIQGLEAGEFAILLTVQNTGWG